MCIGVSLTYNWADSLTGVFHLRFLLSLYSAKLQMGNYKPKLQVHKSSNLPRHKSDGQSCGLCSAGTSSSLLTSWR